MLNCKLFMTLIYIIIDNKRRQMLPAIQWLYEQQVSGNGDFFIARILEAVVCTGSQDERDHTDRDWIVRPDRTQ